MSHEPACSRRTVLRSIGGAAALGAVPSHASAQPSGAVDLDAWFEDVDTYDGLVDATGQSTVRVAVGAPGNGGAFAFSPAAVRVDPGTTVVWEWTGEGGAHDVASVDGAFASPLADAAGTTFEHAFETEGAVRYVCRPHETIGMKGAVVVGDVLVAGADPGVEEPDYDGWFDGVAAFDGTVDATGRSEVRVAVGAGGGRQGAFEPAAVRVDPGTTVVWELVDDRTHTVTAADGSYDSGPLAGGDAFALAFDGDGISRYACETTPGMRGAVVIGGGGTLVHSFTPLSTVLGGGLGLGVAGLLGYGLYHHVRDTTGGGRRTRSAPGATDRGARPVSPTSRSSRTRTGRAP